MKKKTALLGLSLFVLLVISLNVLAETVTKSGFEGKEIQKVIDYLRANGWEDYADNIQEFLDDGKIQKKSLDSGTLGECDTDGNVILDNSWFLSPRSGGWDPTKPVHVGWMMSFASTLVHEKYHAEHHGVWERISSNAWYAMGGNNDMEIEAWTAQLTFLDQHILKLLDRYMDESLSDDEKLDILKTINAIYNEKITLVDDFNEQEYRLGIWNSSTLRHFREHIRRLIEEETENLEGVQEHSTNLKGFELDTDTRLAAVMEGFDPYWPQEYAFRTVSIAATIAGLSPEDSFVTDLVLILDLPSDIHDEAAEFLLDYDGFTQEVEVSLIDEGDIVDAHYTMIIAESTVARIIAQDDQAATARELYADGAFMVSAGVEDVKMEPWAFTLEKDLRQSVDWYNKNIEEVPVAKLIKMTFGNERLNIIFTKGDETATYDIVIRDGVIEDFARGELQNPTMDVRVGYDIMEDIKASPDPAEAVLQALYSNKIKYDLGKDKASPKNILTKGLVRLFDVLKRSPYDIRAGQEKDIDYYGQTARLIANPHDVKIVVIEGAQDLPVVDKAGATLGYTNHFSQNIIKLYPETFSPNAGVYLSPGIDAPGHPDFVKYEEYWDDCPYKAVERLNEVTSPTEAVFVGLSGARYV